MTATTFGKRRAPPPTDDAAPSDSRLGQNGGPELSLCASLSGANAPRHDNHEVELHRRYSGPVLRLEEGVTAQKVDALHALLLELARRQVQEVAIVINSQGGELAPALQFYERVKFLPLRIRTHGTTVHSAATVLFLAGEERTASPNATFLFHPAVAEVSGRLSREAFATGVQRMERLESVLSRVFFERTSLPSATVRRFHRETIVYDAPTALRFGIIHRIETFEPPGDDCDAARG